MHLLVRMPWALDDSKMPASPCCTQQLLVVPPGQWTFMQLSSSIHTVGKSRIPGICLYTSQYAVTV